MGFCLFCLTLLSWIHHSACLANRHSRQFIEWANEWTQARQMLPVCEYLTCSTTVWHVKLIFPSKLWVNGGTDTILPFLCMFHSRHKGCLQLVFAEWCNQPLYHSFNKFKSVFWKYNIHVQTLCTFWMDIHTDI